MDPFFLILPVRLDCTLDKKHSQHCNFQFFIFFFSQGANTRKRGRLSHMLRLIYPKVFFKSSKSCCMDFFSLNVGDEDLSILVVFTFLKNHGGSLILRGIRKMLLYICFFCTSCPELSSGATLYNKCYISAAMHIDPEIALSTYLSYSPFKSQSLFSVTNWSENLKHRFFISVEENLQFLF